MSYDEQPDGDIHGECAAEIHRLEQQRDELLAALENVVAISDRKHDAWDRAHAAIAKVKP